MHKPSCQRPLYQSPVGACSSCPEFNPEEAPCAPANPRPWGCICQYRCSALSCASCANRSLEMGGERRDASNAEKNSGSETHSKETSRDQEFQRGILEENAGNDRRPTCQGGASQNIPVGPFLSSERGAAEEKPSWSEDARALEACGSEDHNAHITDSDSTTRTYAYPIGGKARIEDNGQQTVERKVHQAGRTEAEITDSSNLTNRGQEGGAAVEGRLEAAAGHAAKKTPQSEAEQADNAFKGIALCSPCKTRAKDEACSRCGKGCSPACGVDSQTGPTARERGLSDARRAGVSKTENVLQEKEVRKETQEREIENALGLASEMGVSEKTGSNGNKCGCSIGEGAQKVDSAKKSAAYSDTGEAGIGKLSGDTRGLAPKGQPANGHDGVNSNSLREKSHVDNKAGENSTDVTTGSTPAADVKTEPAGRKPEGSVGFVTGHIYGLNSKCIPAKSDNQTSTAKDNTRAEGVASARQQAKHVDEKGTLAVHGSKGAETHAKCISGGSKSSADTSTTESSKYNLSSSGVCGRSANKTATESKGGIVAIQERNGSGAEDEEDEEEETELLQSGLSGGSEKKEYMASRKGNSGEVMTRAKPTSPRSLSPSPCQYRRKRRRADNGAVATRCKVNVGPRHQVPALPPFFLDSSCIRDTRADRIPETRELYSHDAGDTARLVYSPFAMQRVYKRRLAEGMTSESGIRHADEMNDFIRKVAENWTNKAGWQPFSPEYAYKLLHFAGYDPQRALRIMMDSRFCFTTICDPPQRRYDNKWRPKDRRGQIATHPYPSPLTLRAYLSRKSQHAAATAAADNAHSHG